MADYLSLYIGPATAILVAFVSPWIAVNLSLRRFRREALWSRRVDAYDRVVGALHRMYEILQIDVDAVARNREVSEELETEQLKQFQDAKREILRTVRLGAYLVNRDAGTCLQHYLSELRKDDSLDLFSSLERALVATETCLDKVTDIANLDLNDD